MDSVQFFGRRSLLSGGVGFPRWRWSWHCSHKQANPNNTFLTELRYKFEQKNKQTVMSIKKMKSLSKFDDSNFTRSCGIHNLQFSTNNREKYMCEISDCRTTRKSISILKDSFQDISLHLY